MASGSPNAAVLHALGWPDAQHLTSERLLSLSGRALAMPRGERCPLPALIFQSALSIRGSWASHCFIPLGVLYPNVCGIGPLSSAHCVRPWFQTHAAPLLNRSLRDRLVAAASLRGHDSFPGRRATRHLGLSLSCALCEAPSGDLFLCLSECPASRTFKTSGAVTVPSTQLPFLSGLANHGFSFPAPLSTPPDRVSFVGQVCERFVLLQLVPCEFNPFAGLFRIC